MGGNQFAKPLSRACQAALDRTSGERQRSADGFKRLVGEIAAIDEPALRLVQFQQGCFKCGEKAVGLLIALTTGGDRPPLPRTRQRPEITPPLRLRSIAHDARACDPAPQAGSSFKGRMCARSPARSLRIFAAKHHPLPHPNAKG